MKTFQPFAAPTDYRRGGLPKTSCPVPIPSGGLDRPAKTVRPRKAVSVRKLGRKHLNKGRDMRDFIENLEDGAEAAYYRMLQPNGKLKCSCGKLFEPSQGTVVSPNPYAMPVCEDCFEKYQESMVALGRKKWSQTTIVSIVLYRVTTMNI